MKLDGFQRMAAQKAVMDALKAQEIADRAEADAALRGMYEESGADRVKIDIDGCEVGTLSIRFSTQGYEVTDPEAFEGFCVANGLGRHREAIDPAYMGEAVAWAKRELPEEAVVRTFELGAGSDKLFSRLGDGFIVEGTGEIVPGIAPKAKKPVGTTLCGCKPEKVLPLLAKSPEALGQLLLGGE